MNAKKLLRKMAAETELSERRFQRLIFRTMAPRLFLGLVGYVLWKWLMVSPLLPGPGWLEGLIDPLGVAAIFLATVRPLIRIGRMSDEEMDEFMPDDS